MKKNNSLKSVIVVIAVLFSFSAIQAQDVSTPKIVNLQEILSPVSGENFAWGYQASAAWGDFNNDGYLDLITTSYNEFSPEFDGEGNPIPVKDENGDDLPLPDPLYDDGGNLKRVAVCATRLFKNNGDGTFTKVTHPIPHFREAGIAWLDYNNDGNLDVFIAGTSQFAGEYSGLWKNTGEAGNYAFEEVFEAEFDYFRGSGDSDTNTKIIGAGDYDNDGWVDIAMMGWTGSDLMTELYKNLEGEGFLKTAPVNGSIPFQKMEKGMLHWGDIDRDGDLDLITAGYLHGDWTILEGYDKSLFYDGRPHVNEGRGISGAIVVYINNGDGTFEMPTSKHIYPYGEKGGIDLGDYNNDGYLDFYATGHCWWWDPNKNDGAGGEIGWDNGFFVNKKDGTFERFIGRDLLGLEITQAAIAWGDINNDGWEDITMTNAHKSSSFLNNAGQFPFSRLTLPFLNEQGELDADDNGNYGLDVREGTTCVVDYNNNGALDIFMCGYDDRNVRMHLFNNELDAAEGITANQAPSAPTNLKAETSAEGITVFTWDASTDDLTPAEALRYNLYVKQGDVVKMALPADLTTGRLKVNEALAPIMGTTYKMSGLEGNYEWGVQAIDNGKQAGAFAKLSVSAMANISKLAVTVVGKKQAIEVTAANDLQGALNIYSISGVNMYTQTGQINGTTVELPAGAYIVKIASVEGTSVNKVIVK